MGDGFSDIFEEHEFGDTNLADDDLFSIFESLENVAEFPPIDEDVLSSKEGEETARLVSQKSTSSSALQYQSETELETSPKSKRPKLAGMTSEEEANPDGQQRMSHITVERNRRKQMNEHLSVLRSLMPCFYVKRVRTTYIFSILCFPFPLYIFTAALSQRRFVLKKIEKERLPKAFPKEKCFFFGSFN